MCPRDRGQALPLGPCGVGTLPEAPVIDSHQHFWSLGRGDYGWLTPGLQHLYRDFVPKDLAPLLASYRISGTVLVQAAASDAETDYILQLAATTSFVKGVVGWVDMSGPHVRHRLRSLATRQAFRGVRPMIQDIDDDAWMLRPELAPAFEELVDRRLSFDALVKPQHLDNLLVLLSRYPSLAVAIDHGGKPNIAAGGLQPWARQMQLLAEETSAVCKLSGLVTEATAAWQSSDLEPFVDHLLTVFGSERLMWGSDWPVVNLAGGYGRWWQFVQEWLSTRAAADRAHIMGGTAARFYRL